MDLSFLCTNDENIWIKFVEVKTETAGESDKTDILLIGFTCEFEANYFFWLEFVLHEHPVHNSSIRTDGVEVDVLGHVRVPGDLPDGVSVFLSPNIGAINRLLMLIPNIINQYLSIIKSNSKQSRAPGMEIQ